MASLFETKWSTTTYNTQRIEPEYSGKNKENLGITYFQHAERENRRGGQHGGNLPALQSLYSPYLNTLQGNAVII